MLASRPVQLTLVTVLVGEVVEGRGVYKTPLGFGLGGSRIQGGSFDKLTTTLGFGVGRLRRSVRPCC